MIRGLRRDFHVLIPQRLYQLRIIRLKCSEPLTILVFALNMMPLDQDLENVAALYLTCDFEAVTTLVLAVRSPNRFRAFDLESPRRIVVDVEK